MGKREKGSGSKAPALALTSGRGGALAVPAAAFAALVPVAPSVAAIAVVALIAHDTLLAGCARATGADRLRVAS